MSDIAIKVEGLGKLYRIGQREPYRTLRDTITNVFTAPVRWVRNSQSAIRNPKSDTIWALKDVSFEAEQGEVIGVIGRNGAGKSTLLKVLSRITEPTKGYADIYGRVGSLLEVGTGFHPELTGRENIYLNGAILGMKKKEIEEKFDEIVSFSEVEKFIDTPIKHYSSGMHMRLAFSVAAHLESEILLIDEVLAVGDAAFQQKCITKMGDASHQGRTILFVSHNMGAIGRLCQRCLLLEEGRIRTFGEVGKVIPFYLQGIGNGGAELLFAPDEQKTMQIRAIRLLDHEGHPSTTFDRSLPFRVETEYDVRKPVLGAYVAVTLDGSDGTVILSSADIDGVPRGLIEREVGTYISTVEFPGGILNAGTCVVRVGIARYGGSVYDYHVGSSLILQDCGTFASMGGSQRSGVLAMPLKWVTQMQRT